MKGRDPTLRSIQLTGRFPLKITFFPEKALTQANAFDTKIFGINRL